MPKEKKSYISYDIQTKTEELANEYAKTGEFSHRYLAYRDLQFIFKQYVKGTHALDYGTGTGLSASYLHEAGFNVVGADVNPLMLHKARNEFPHLQFFEIEKLKSEKKFDLIFSSFVLFDMKSKNEIIEYLNKGDDHLNDHGVFIIVTGADELYSMSRKWTAYESNFDENKNLKSGDVAKIRLKNPPIEFKDYYWKESDYIECFQKANLKMLYAHKPLGKENDPYLWEDERLFSPFTIYILEKNRR